jgi:hypothetical protein
MLPAYLRKLLDCQRVEDLPCAVFRSLFKGFGPRSCSVLQCFGLVIKCFAAVFDYPLVRQRLFQRARWVCTVCRFRSSTIIGTGSYYENTSASSITFDEHSTPSQARESWPVRPTLKLCCSRLTISLERSRSRYVPRFLALTKRVRELPNRESLQSPHPESSPKRGKCL